MVLVIAIGVTCSTLVNAPVAMLFTISFITLILPRFLSTSRSASRSAGPVESLYRIITQMNKFRRCKTGTI